MSTGGMDIDKKKTTILLMHGSGLTHIVWSLHEQFYASLGFNVLSVDLVDGVVHLFLNAGPVAHCLDKICL